MIRDHHRDILTAGIACAVALATPAFAESTPSDALDQWGQWRGPSGSGEAPRGKPPLVWSESRNVRWKTAIPGKGHSTPVVWGDRVYLTAAIPYGDVAESKGQHAHGGHDNVASHRKHEFVVLAIDRRNGSILWRRTVLRAQPHESTHETGSWASSSPVTDGERVYASFGSQGIYCLDTAGELLWQTDLGEMQIKHGHGEGSSPALAGNTLVVNWDHEDGSFVVALDARTGKERWKRARQEKTSWSTPLIVKHEGSRQVIVAATNRVRAYDLESGKPIWECGGLSGNVVASPVAGEGLVYVANSYETREMMAIRLAGAKGDITGTENVVWTRHRDTPYVPSPIYYRGALCFLKHYQGLWTCVNASDGATLFGPSRLPGIRNVYASPVAADGRIYVIDLHGTALVLAHGEVLEVLAQNRLNDSFSASPAIVGDELFLRGERALYCLGERPTE